MSETNPALDIDCRLMFSHWQTTKHPKITAAKKNFAQGAFEAGYEQGHKAASHPKIVIYLDGSVPDFQKLDRINDDLHAIRRLLGREAINTPDVIEAVRIAVERIHDQYQTLACEMREAEQKKIGKDSLSG